MIKYTCGAGTPEEAETNCTYFIRGECTASFCEYRRKKQTNADRIRSMSDEELAAKISSRCISDIVCGGNCKAFATLDKTSQQQCVEIVLDWLKQPAEEET